MKNEKQKIVVIVLAATAALISAMIVVYVFSGVSEAIVLKKPVLDSLRKEWVLDGSPENPQINKYVTNWTDPDRFFVWTNVYNINGHEIYSLFGMKDPKFEGKGILIISKDGRLIWDNKKGRVKMIK